MINFDGSDARKEIEEAFGTLTSKQIYVLVKLTKHIRGRCRNNSAYNNYMNRIFNPNFIFKEVMKEWQGRSYKGLDIIDRTGAKLPDSGEDSE